MSGSLAVTWQELSTASNTLKSTEGDIRGQLSKMKSMIDNLGGTWQGAAAGAYNTMYANWDKGAAQLFESLSGIADMLAKAATAYEQTENQLKSGFSG